MPTDQEILKGQIKTASRLRSLHSASYCRSGSIPLILNDAAAILAQAARCKSWRCPDCGPLLAAHWAYRIAHSRPERFLTLTCDVARFATPLQALAKMRFAFPRLIAILRHDKRDIEYCAIWELTKAGYPHLHVALRGSFLPQGRIKRIWDQLGCGTIVHIEPIADCRSVARYVSKYMTKSRDSGAAFPPHMRLIQCSRGFLLDPPPEECLRFDKLEPAHFVHASTYDVVTALMSHFPYDIDHSYEGRSVLLRYRHGPAPPELLAEVNDLLSGM